MTARTLAMTSYPTSAAAIKGVLFLVNHATDMTGAIASPYVLSFLLSNPTHRTLLEVVRHSNFLTSWEDFAQSGQLPAHTTGHSQVKTIEIPDMTRGNFSRTVKPTEVALSHRYLPSANLQQA